MAANVTYPGQNAGAGDTRAKFLTLFTGEVLAAFARKNVALTGNLVTVQTISGGKTAQFITTGRIDESAVTAHVAGTDITTTVVDSNERLITVGSPYYVSSFVDKFEEKLSQFNVRTTIATQHAEVLATVIDKAIFRGIFNSRLVAPQGGQTASASVTAAATVDVLLTAEQRGDALIDAIFAAQAKLDENDVPLEGRTFVTFPSFYYNIVQSHKAVNRDFNGMDNGSIGGGRVLNIAGLTIVQSNNLPKMTLDVIPVATNLVGMVFTKDVFGVLKANDITSEVNYDLNKLGDVLTSYYAIGMGTLNPSPLAVIFSA
ncbi:MAG: hypothetical protein JHC33_07695 [Ignisphaera sp.]|nr:hypothetical protein [Ignisphaera sp.]